MSDSETGGDAKRGRARAKKAAEPRSDNSEEPKAKRGRGRPKGTAKKPKKAAASKSPGGGKRGRGRPPKKTGPLVVLAVLALQALVLNGLLQSIVV